MRLTFIANAGCVYESQGYRLLADPWLTEGAFEGSWFHYPPLRTRAADLLDVDALYISHAHPDHYDPAVLRVLAAHRPHRPVLVLADTGLARLLRDLGFTSVRACYPGASSRLGPFTATLYPAFAPHVFHAATLENHLDSACVLEADGQVVLNANDNTPTLAAAAALRERHGPPDLAQLNYNAAGPYPSCFRSLTPTEQQDAADVILARNLDHMVAVARALQARAVMPFAGQYVLGGRQGHKNAVLGTTTWDAAAANLRAHDLTAVVLSEGLTVDVADGRVSGGTYQPIDVAALEDYAVTLAALRYPYEHDDVPWSRIVWTEKIVAGVVRMRVAHDASDCGLPWTIAIVTPHGEFRFRLDRLFIRRVEAAEPLAPPYLRCAMDPRLLRRILDGRARWNHAEIGCHIEFWRAPDEYRPDLHALLEHFHA